MFLFPKAVAASVIYTAGSHGQSRPVQSHLNPLSGFVLARLTAVEIAQPRTAVHLPGPMTVL